MPSAPVVVAVAFLRVEVDVEVGRRREVDEGEEDFLKEGFREERRGFLGGALAVEVDDAPPAFSAPAPPERSEEGFCCLWPREGRGSALEPRVD